MNIIESVISDTSEDNQTDDDDDIEEVQPTCKQVTDGLNIAIKFFEMESSTVESDMAKLLFYFKGLVKKLQAKRVSLDDFFKKQYLHVLIQYCFCAARKETIVCKYLF